MNNVKGRALGSYCHAAAASQVCGFYISQMQMMKMTFFFFLCLLPKQKLENVCFLSLFVQLSLIGFIYFSYSSSVGTQMSVFLLFRISAFVFISDRFFDFLFFLFFVNFYNFFLKILQTWIMYQVVRILLELYFLPWKNLTFYSHLPSSLVVFE